MTRIDITATSNANDNTVTYVVWDESGHREVITATSAEEAASDYVDIGSWSESTETVHHLIHVARDGEDESETVMVSREPEEPPCSSANGHDWEEVYLRSSDHGGCRSLDVCRHCGCRWHHDSGATHPQTGERVATNRYERA